MKRFRSNSTQFYSIALCPVLLAASPEQERGYYLYGEMFNKHRERRIGWGLDHEMVRTSKARYENQTEQARQQGRSNNL